MLISQWHLKYHKMQLKTQFCQDFAIDGWLSLISSIVGVESWVMGNFSALKGNHVDANKI